VGRKGVVVLSRFDSLRSQLSSRLDPLLLGTVKYSEAANKGYNQIQFTKAMARTSKKTATAGRGEDISSYFTNKFTVVRPVRRVNVDLTEGMLRELDHRAARLNISRLAAVKALLARALAEEGAVGSRRKKGGSGDPPQA
jgi:hypothetical protein